MSRGSKPGNDGEDTIKILHALSIAERKMKNKIPKADKRDRFVIRASDAQTGNRPYDAGKN